MIGAGRAGRWALHGYFVILALFLYAPLAVLVVFAFNKSSLPVLPITGWSTHWFHQAFSNPDLTGSVRRSFELAVINGIIATGLGVLAAAGLAARKLFLRSAITTLLLLPLVVPYIVLAVGLVILLHQLNITTSLTAVLAIWLIVVVLVLMLVFGRFLSADLRTARAE